ncbi:MAG: molybdopterin dehydrogenase [Syntrophus sp. (in: bacteria)]|nr:molybdopterin dehydrogenase [Syntrophus sp. (in: bacteria)]
MSDVLLPKNLHEVWKIFDKSSETLVYAGGTDLLVKLASSRVPHSTPNVLVCLENIEELRNIRETDGRVRIGACVTHSRLLSHPLIRDNFPVLPKALRLLGSPPVRNMGTLGGNICTASPAGDALPALYLLDAELEISSQKGSRFIPIGQFIKGPGYAELQSGEILIAIWLDKNNDYTIHHFEKVGQRNALAISIASMAALIKLSSEGIVEKIRLAWGSVAPTIALSSEVETVLIGKPLSQVVLNEARPLLNQAISPIDDIRAKAEYRRTVAANLLIRLSRYNGHDKV